MAFVNLHLSGDRCGAFFYITVHIFDKACVLVNRGKNSSRDKEINDQIMIYIWSIHPGAVQLKQIQSTLQHQN